MELNNPKTLNHKPASILAFTLLLLVLMSLMGIYVLTNTSAELSISGQNRIGREAFNAADSSVRVAVLLGRILLHPELGPPSQALKTAAGPVFPLKVEINQSRLNLASLQKEAAEFDFAKRYREAVVNDPSGSGPHLIFKVHDKVVGTAVISLETDVPIGAGFSLGSGDRYDNGGGSNVQINLVVTASGSPSSGPKDRLTEPHSIITAIYREYQ
ncbi:MAG: hypothetical protein LBT47_00950 [Deltaproteobacteria bacterium]|jgi:hypothetical protein|nr:hypothetical protein [Deltaproteobacteria bacterium]